ncbi:MAG: hypothetical protein E7537_05340 [Ruminococcaceae bacterium]|nr:hypothetical protein [Oscillospiraceae bacterium]
MTYCLLKKADDADIPLILSVYKQPLISQFISIDEKNTASINLFESAKFVCVGKDTELLEYEYSKG